MKIENFYYFVLGVLSLHENAKLISAKAVNVSATDKRVAVEIENFMNCSQHHPSKECLSRTGV